MSKEKSPRLKIKRLSRGVLNSTMDLVVFTTALGINLYSLSGPAGLRKTPLSAIETALKFVSHFRKERIKTALYNSTSKNLLNKKKGYFKLTEEGKDFLRKILPQYQKGRPWDGKLYLITYDIIENQRTARDKLRQKLKDISCGMVQRSVWFTPYDPTTEIEKIASYLKLEGAIIVSSLEETKSIWGESLIELIWKAYELEILNHRYEAFIEEVGERKKTKANLLSLVFLYLSILHDDPQLPPQLLKENWLGDKAHQVFKKKVLHPLFAEIRLSGAADINLHHRQTLLELLES